MNSLVSRAVMNWKLDILGFGLMRFPSHQYQIVYNVCDTVLVTGIHTAKLIWPSPCPQVKCLSQEDHTQAHTLSFGEVQ